MDVFGWLTQRQIALWKQGKWALCGLVTIVILLLFIIALLVEPQLEAWVASTYGQARPVVVDWVIQAYNWPFSWLIFAFLLFLLATTLIEVIGWSLNRHHQPQAKECALQHVTPEESTRLGWLNTLEREERQEFEKYVIVNVKPDIDNFFDAPPYIEFEFQLTSFSIHSLLVGKVVSGYIQFSTHFNNAKGPIGDVPQKIPNKQQKCDIRVRRGKASFYLRQMLYPDTRDRLLNTGTRQKDGSAFITFITFDLTQLYISVDILEPEESASIQQLRLPVPPTIQVQVKPLAPDIPNAQRTLVE